MADPFSIAGTAVGITSLGLQVCQGLFHYYDKFRGLHDEIDDILRRAKGLEEILKSLEPIARRYENDSSEVPPQLQSALTACEKALQRLRSMVEKCGKTKECDSFQDRLRLARKRLLWPFKRDTLLELQDALNRFQDNLSLALQSLGLNDILHRLEALQGSTTVLVDRTIRIEDQVGVVSQNIFQLSSEQQQHSSQMQEEMATLRAQLTVQTAVMGRMLNTLATGTNTIYDPTRTKPAYFVEASQTIQDTTPHFRKTLQRYNTLQNTNNVGQVRPSGCTCDWLHGKQQSWSRWRTITLHTKESYTHQPSCPHHAHTNFSKAVEVRFNMKLYRLQYCVQVGWQMAQDRGWRNVQPILRYRAVVPNDSPVFALLDRTTHEIIRQGFTGKFSQQTVETKIHTILSTLRRSFGNGASPTDVNESGDTIFHAMIEMLLWLTGIYFCNPHLINSLIDACIAQNIPCNEPNERGETPIIWWQHRLCTRSANIDRNNATTAVFSHMARRIDNWSVIPHGYHRSSASFYDTTAKVLSWDESVNRLGEDDLVLVALLRRSEAEFLFQIQKVRPEHLVNTFMDRKYTKPLVTWAVGLGILISSTPQNDLQRLLDLLRVETLRFGSLTSMQLLLQSGVTLSIDDWTILHENPVFISVGSVRDLMWGEYKEHKENLRDVLLTVARRYLDESSSNRSLYHIRNLSLISAKCLWDVGHHDINTVQTQSGFEFTIPLWTASVFNPRPWAQRWPLVKWLIEKGADITWTHPIYHATPAHVLGSRIGDYNENNLPFHGFLSTFDPILLCSKLDQCECYCSYQRGGCHVIGCTIRCHPYELCSMARGIDYTDCRGLVERHVYALVDYHRDLRWMSSAVLRVMTFERLSLTHTCCVLLMSEVCRRTTRPTKEEAKEIHDIEREDIDLLDKLMEEFEALWDTYGGTFSRFVKRVWRPKMRSALKGKQDFEDVYRETGVELRQVEGKYRPGYVSESSDSEDEDTKSLDDEFESASESGGQEEVLGSELEEQATSQQSL